MWTVECVANNAPGGRPSKRPALCLLPNSEVATEAARFQVEQLRKQWPVSEIRMSGESPFTCGIFVADSCGNAGSYQVIVRECDQTFDDCQMSALESLMSVSTRPTKRNKSMMLMPPQHSTSSGSLSELESRSSCSDVEADSGVPGQQRSKRLRSNVSEMWSGLADPFTDRTSGDAFPYRASSDIP